MLLSPPHSPYVLLKSNNSSRGKVEKKIQPGFCPGHMWPQPVGVNCLNASRDDPNSPL